MNAEQMDINERNEIIKAIQFALKMENDGKEYYLSAVKKSSSELGRELFLKLSSDEDDHRKKFEEIFQEINQKHSWPDVHLTSAREEVKTIFSRKAKIVTIEESAFVKEFKAIDQALDMEDQSRKFYQEQVQKTRFPAGKEFYQALVGEEQGHYLALTDYREYLEDPADWYTAKEHHSLDGV